MSEYRFKGRTAKPACSLKLCHFLSHQKRHQGPFWKLAFIYFSNQKFYVHHFQSSGRPSPHGWHLAFSRAHRRGVPANCTQGCKFTNTSTLRAARQHPLGDIPCKAAGLRGEHQGSKTFQLRSQKPQVSHPALQLNSLDFTSHPPPPVTGNHIFFLTCFVIQR